MKKLNRKLALSVTSVLLSLSTFTSSNLYAKDFLSPGVFKIGMEVAYPPFESYENGKVVGFDPELTSLLSEKMGVTPEYSDNKFTTLILGLKANKFDAVISGLYITPERLEVANAIPYAKTGASILVTKGSSIRPATKEELCGLEVGLQQGTSWVKSLSDLSVSYCENNDKEPITIKTFPSSPEVTQALLSHNVDAQIEVIGAAKIMVEKTKGRVEIVSPDLVYPLQIGIYINKNNVKLKAKIEKALAEISANGSLSKLIKKYGLIGV